MINIVFIYLFFRYFPNVISDYLDHNMLTFILCVVCTPHYFKNPYLVSKLIEILFVINPAVQERTQDLNIRMMTNQISADYLPSALMNFYTGKPYIFFEFPSFFSKLYIELKSGVTIELPWRLEKFNGFLVDIIPI